MGWRAPDAERHRGTSAGERHVAVGTLLLVFYVALRTPACRHSRTALVPAYTS